MTDDDKKKSTLKLKGSAAPRGDRAPVRGMNTPKKRPTLAEAQAEREQRARERPPRREDGGGFGGPRSDRPPREGSSFSDRPPRRDDRGPSGPRGDRPPREGGSFGDRPPRRDDRGFAGPRGDRPQREGGPRGDRPPREGGSFGDRPPRRDDRGFGGPRADRPPREGGSFGDRPPRRDDRGFGGPRADRPPREGGSFGDRPPRRDDRGFGGPRGDRPPREGNSFGDRPPRRDDRGFAGPRGDRPQREGGPRGDRPPREGGSFGDRPPRRDDGGFGGPRGDRPPREGGSFGDRPPRRDDGGFGGPRGDRPPREGGSFGDRPPRRDDRGPAGPRTDRPPREGGAWGERPQRRDDRRFEGPREDRPARQATPRINTEAEGERLSKVMADRGLASRREADEWIEMGWVRVDGKLAVLGQRVAPEVQIEIDPAAQKQQAQRVTILLHKPIGLVSGQPEDGYEPAVSLIRPDTRWAEDPTQGHIHFNPAQLRGLAPAGRLDIDSTGLLVFTQDGRVAKALIGDDSEVEKEYLVRVAPVDAPEGEAAAPMHSFPEAQLALLNHGLELDGVQLRPAKVSWANEDQLRFVLREGRKRQIRRMCELVGLKVLGLKRVRMGRIPLSALPMGQWRYLAPWEKF